MLGGMIRYGQSKLGDVLLASELARRHPNITSVSVTPGIVNTDLVKTMGAVHRGIAWLSATLAQGGFMTPEDGAKSLLWCVTAPTSKIKSGEFYEPIGELSKLTTKYSRDPNLAKRLWAWTDAELQSWK
jgi:NAD(P)-dependent dehydrogenase (short-subunit alcohol dehydrogenase family)